MLIDAESIELVREISMPIGQRNMEVENYSCNFGKQHSQHLKRNS